MKNIVSSIKNFCKVMLAGCVVLAGVAASTLEVGAASQSANYTSLSTNIFLSIPVTVSSLQISASTSNAATVILYDTAYGSNVTAVGEYTYPSNYVSNVVSTYVTTTGVTNFLTNRVLYTATVTVAADANTALPAAATFTVPAGATTTFPVELVFSKGVLIKVDTNATINATYQTGP
jgi:hypothetical protein